MYVLQCCAINTKETMKEEEEEEESVSETHAATEHAQWHLLVLLRARLGSHSLSLLSHHVGARYTKRPLGDVWNSKYEHEAFRKCNQLA